MKQVMQIITVDDYAFPELMTAWSVGKQVGRYWRNGQTLVVCATRQFLLVTSEHNPQKIAIKPTRTLDEAQALGVQLLNREAQRGNRIQVEPEFVR